MRQPSPELLIPLLEYLAQAGAQAEPAWQGWQISRISGGANNLIYRATGDAADLAVKFAIRDARDRAGREYDALRALQEVDLSLAPMPILVERDWYANPVVVQTWLAGAVMGAPPAGDEDWDRLLRHYLTIRRVTPATTTLPLRAAVLTMTSAAEGRQQVHQQAARIPPADQPAALRQLIRRLDAAAFPDWPAPPLALCRCDPNTTNFIRRDGELASVDWENSGWGDPAFDIADLIAHPAYATVPEARWEWVMARYADVSGDAAAAHRIRTYSRLMVVWWVARFARSVYEMPRGLDQRLAERTPGWHVAEIQARYERYAAQAAALLG